MEKIPVVGFAAFSGTGKTTLIEKILRILKTEGYRVAVIKHDAHRFEIDREGKDSWRFSRAGADMMLISSAEKTAIIEHRERTFEENLAMIHDVDMILVEGYKQEGIPKIGLSRCATGKGLPGHAEQYLAIATDDITLAENCPVPCFSLDDAEGLSNLIKSALL